MAFDESEVPENVRDILAYMPRDMRQRVLADYDTHYAPFLAMLAGWKNAVQTHYAMGENAAIARLQEQFFPLGNWNFPAQTLAVPQSPVERATDVPFGTAFTEVGKRPWMACGDGWLHPTQLQSLSMQIQEREAIVTLDITLLSSQSNSVSLLERGQLAFVAGNESLLGVLQSANWWVQIGTGENRPARLTRYEGFLAFEREMQTARLNQRQLDFWLPPCHPYARKIICLQSDGGADRRDTPPVPSAPSATDGLRFTARLPLATPAVRRAAQEFAALPDSSRLLLNPIPLAQTAVVDSIIPAPFPRIGQEYGLRLSGLPNIFAAVTYNDNSVVPASMQRLPSHDPRAKYDDVEVRFAQGNASIARVKLYHDSFGQEREDGSDTPARLERANARFTVPLPAIGGLSVGGPEDRAEWARTAWYQSTLRPPLLTEGDLMEIVRQRSQGAFGQWLRLQSASRGIAQEPSGAAEHWKSYLWPSILGNEDGFELSRDGLTAGFVPLLQSLHLAFAPTPAASGTAPWLLSDVANYLASVVSQYFVLSCFRIDGRVVGAEGER